MQQEVSTWGRPGNTWEYLGNTWGILREYWGNNFKFQKKNAFYRLGSTIIVELTPNNYCNIFIAWSNKRGVRFGKHGFNKEIGCLGRISYPARATYGQI